MCGNKMFEAIMDNDFQLLKILINSGYDVNCTNSYGNTPLHSAVQSKTNLELIEFLLKDTAFGSEEIKSLIADVQLKVDYGSTPAGFAALESNGIKMVKVLIQHGADINAENYDGETPLHVASYLNKYGVVKFLIEQGANQNARNYTGKTPLHLVCQFSFEMSKLLIELGADVNAEDNLGFRPLHLAVRKTNNTEILKLLIDNGADINAKNFNFQTPFLCACQGKDIKNVKFLYEMCPDLTVKDRNGLDCLYYASPKFDIFQFLLINAIDINPYTADNLSKLNIPENWKILMYETIY